MVLKTDDLLVRPHGDASLPRFGHDEHDMSLQRLEQPRPGAVSRALVAAALLGAAAAHAGEPAHSKPPIDRWARPTTVVVLLDRSMPDYRLTLAKDAIRALLAKLQPTDRLGIIAAGGEALTQSGSRLLTDDGRRRLLAWLAETGVSTGSAELGLGPTLQMSDSLLDLTATHTASAHLIVVSDGAHVPGVLSNAELQRAVTALAKRGVVVDAVAPGAPQTRPPLEALAELGNGRLLVLKTAADIEALLTPVAR